jgi:hypothetical protein
MIRTDTKTRAGCLGRAISGAISGGCEFAVGVLADQLPHKLVVKLFNYLSNINLKPYNLISAILKPFFLPK